MATLTTPPAGAPELEHSSATLNEPSMEDILASIRRIIAEDQSNSLARPASNGFARRAAAATAATEAPPAPHVDDPVLRQAQPPVEDEPDEASLSLLRPTQTPEHEADHEAPPALALPEQTVPPGGAPLQDTFVVAELDLPPSDSDRAEEETPLISPAAGASITSSFHALAESVMLQDPAMIERVTRETLRPMLKSWLDDNLPSIVERLVRAEIERVARGGGRGRD